MRFHRYDLIWLATLAVAASACDGATAQERPRGVNRKPDVIFVPTPEPVVAKMLSMARVRPGDVVYDLGCGDGRIPIAAVRDFGAHSAVCVDIDPRRIREARANVERAGLQSKVDVRHADMFEVDLTPATVVTLYLLERLNLELRPKLNRELRNGARVVSQTFGMGDWKPADTANVDGTAVYLWNISKAEPRRTPAR